MAASSARRFRRAVPGLGALLFASVLGGCAGSVQTRSEVDGAAVSSAATIHLNAADALLEQARTLASQGEYARALGSYQTVAADRGAKPEQRAQALLGIGQVHSNVLNPKRDVERAIASYRQLFAEYPDSKVRPQAEQALAALEARKQP